MDEKTPNIGWVYFVAILFCALGLTIFLWKGNGANNLNAQESAIVSPASGIFIIPPGGMEVSRDTTGKRVAYYNIGDKIIIDVTENIPDKLYSRNIKEKSVRIRKRRTILTVVNLLSNYVGFKNFSKETAKVKATIIRRG